MGEKGGDDSRRGGGQAYFCDLLSSHGRLQRGNILLHGGNILPGNRTSAGGLGQVRGPLMRPASSGKSLSPSRGWARTRRSPSQPARRSLTEAAYCERPYSPSLITSRPLLIWRCTISVTPVRISASITSWS